MLYIMKVFLTIFYYILQQVPQKLWFFVFLFELSASICNVQNFKMLKLYIITELFCELGLSFCSSVLIDQTSLKKNWHVLSISNEWQRTILVDKIKINLSEMWTLLNKLEFLWKAARFSKNYPSKKLCAGKTESNIKGLSSRSIYKRFSQHSVWFNCNF